MSCSDPGRTNHLSRVGGLILGMILVPALVGCQNRPLTGQASTATVASTPGGAGVLSLEDAHLIGPSAARRLGYRFDWQAGVLPRGTGDGMKMIEVDASSVYALDGENFLTRLNRGSGAQIWRIPAAEPIKTVHGIRHIPSVDHVFVMTDTDVFEYEGATGSLITRQTLEKVANTAPVVVGRTFVYGARNGDLVWHDYGVGYELESYNIGKTMRYAPVLAGNAVLAIGDPGMVAMLRADAPVSFWLKNILAMAAARPAVGADAAYLVDADQAIWALSLRNGRTMWHALTTSRLTESPVVMDDRVYVRIGDDGLACFEAAPVDKPRGVQIWKSEARGSVIGSSASHLLVWDRDRRVMTTVDPRTGAVAERIDLPKVKAVKFSSTLGGPLYALGDDGRVTRLSPR